MGEFRCIYVITVVDAESHEDAYRQARAAAAESERADWDIDDMAEEE